MPKRICQTLSAVLLLATAGLRAQTPAMYCSATTGAPAVLRAEGVAELVSDVVLTCSGGSTGTAGPVNIALYLANTVPTSRIVNQATSDTEALLMVDDLNGGATPGVNLYQGKVSSNAVVFPGVTFNVPGSGTRTLRITNLRVDASQLQQLPDGTPPQLQGFISISGATAVPLNNPMVTLGTVVRGMGFRLMRAGDDAVVPSLAFDQSGGLNPALVTNSLAESGTINYRLHFDRAFTDSFKPRVTSTTPQNPTGTADQAVPGTAYKTESGFYSSTLSSATGLHVAGLATQGTRLMARFSNIPAGVKLYVSVRRLPSCCSNSGLNFGGEARLIAADPVSGAGTYSEVSKTTSATLNETAIDVAPINWSGATSATAVWEVLANPDAADSGWEFGLVVAYTASSAATSTVTGSLGPVSTSGTADSSSPVPRFSASSAVASDACATGPCLFVADRVITLSYQTGNSLYPSASTLAGGTSSMQISAAASSPYNWLSVTAGASTPAPIIINADPSALPVGVYTGTVTVTGANAINGPQVVMVVLTVTAGSAPPPMSCSALAAVAPLIRVEGVTELIGDIVLLCNGGVPGQVSQSTIQVVLNADVTNRILNPATGALDALLLVDEPGVSTSATLTPGSNLFQGTLVGPRTVRFSNVPVTTPQTYSQRVLRITNIRINATQVPAGTSFLGGPVSAALSSSPFIITDYTQTVGFVQPAMGFSVETAAGVLVSTGIPFDQSGGLNTSLATSSVATGGSLNYLLRFTEKFATAFKLRGSAAQNMVGAVYNTESGFVTAAASGGGSIAGLADTATRLMARFTQVPSGVRLYVTTSQIPQSQWPEAAARLVATDINGVGTYTETAATTTVNVNGTPIGIAPVILNGGSGTTAWEITGATSLSADQYVFGLVVAYVAPVAGRTSPGAMYVPLATTMSANATAPVPRFVGPPAGLSVSSTHVGSFARGENGAIYTVTVSNAGAAGPTVGTVTVTDTLPAGLTLVSMAGSGWTCVANSCSLADALEPGASYPPITVTVNVAANAASQVVNQVEVTGGGAASATATDPTAVMLASTTSLASSSNPATLGTPVTLTATVTSGATGTVTFYDGTNVLGTKTLAGGQAVLTTSLLPSGTRSLWARYSGDATHRTSRSASLPQTVTAAPASGFGVPAYYSLSKGAMAMAVADFNGDGIADMVVSNWSSNSDVGVLLGKGDGTFGNPAYYSVGAWPQGVTVGDFNGDGKADLATAVANLADGKVSVLLGKGDGTFQPAVQYSTVPYPWTVLTGDFNGDGITDLVAIRSYNNEPNISVLLGNGNGTFNTAINSTASMMVAFSASVGDFNNDGKADLVLGYMGGVTVALGNGDGTFDPVGRWGWTGGTGLTYLAAADFDGNGTLDVAATNNMSSTVTIMLNRGDGYLTKAADYATSGPPRGVVVGDFNGDGRTDLAVSNDNSTVDVLLGKGDATFQQAVANAVDYSGGELAVTELNGDGRTDLLVATNAQRFAVLLGRAPLATIVSPAAGSTFSGTSATFAWTTVPGADNYWLDVGSTAGQGDISAGATTTVSKTVSGLPCDGRTIHVQLWTHVGGAWQSPQRSTYVACKIVGLAQITSPPAGSTLPGSTVTFSWTAASGASGYWLDVGTVQGQGNISGAYMELATTATLSAMPTNGGTIYVRLWTRRSGVWEYVDYTYTAASVAMITAPTPGLDLTGGTVTFAWGAVSGATAYWLDVGTVQGQGNIFAQNVALATTQTVNGVPSGGNVWVRLWTQRNGAWLYSDYSYVAVPSRAVVATPTPRSILTGGTVTFTWGAVSNAAAYWLDVGTVLAHGNIFAQNVALATTRTVSGIPTNGATIYVRLWTQRNGGWLYNDYTYTAASNTTAVVASPTPGSTLSGATVRFTWDAVSGATAYWLEVGTMPGQGNLFGQNVALATTQTVSGIPANGSAIYVRLWTQRSGAWLFNDYTYTAAAGTVAAMTSPTPGSVLSGAIVTFSWGAISGATAYWLDVGTAQGQGNIFGQNVGTVASRTVTGVPTNGSTIYVRLWTQRSGAWQYNDYTYTVGTSTVAALISPTPGSTLSGGTVTFNWGAVSGATAYWLDVGTIQGQGNIFGQNVGMATSGTVTGIPTNGSTIFVRLWTQRSGAWQYHDYAYQAPAP